MKNKIFNNKLILIILFFLMWFAVFLRVWPISGDDLNYYSHVNKYGLFYILHEQFTTWTARGIIEFFQFILYILPQYEWFFRVINSAMFTLIAYCTVKYCSEFSFTADRKKTFVIMSAAFLFPIDILATAGWIATSANYLWPAAIGMYAFLPIVEYLKNKKIKKHYYIFSTLAMIFACNEEQVSALLFTLLASIIVYLLIKKRRIFIYGLVLDLIAFGMMLFSLTWSGNANRKESEIISWNPVFNMQGIPEKAINGFLSTNYYLLLSSSILVLIMCILFALVIRQKYRDRMLSFIGWIPAGFFAIFGTFKNLTLQIFPAIKQLYILDIDDAAVFNSDIIVSCTIQIFIILLIALCLMLAFGGEKGLLIGLLWLGGYATRVIMGFSPTLYASSTRTFSFLATVIIIIYVLLIQEYYSHNPKQNFPYKLIVLHMAVYLYLFYLV